MMAVRLRLYALGFVVLGFLLCGCGGDDGPGPGEDAGSGEDGGGMDIDGGEDVDAGPFMCAIDADCDDGLYCNGEETCDPSSDRAAADGCVPPETARDCDDGVSCTNDSCDESARNCRHAAPDIDGDGHGDIACVDSAGMPIGDDCNDADARAFPGNGEVCDGHDDDCNPDTFGFTDADMDGAASSACCNGSNCGPDCDDANNAIGPGRPDGPGACDNVDNDCDGTRDEGCPCVDGAERDCGSAAAMSRIGVCRPGSNFCVGGVWSEGCTGVIEPTMEACDSEDDDCDMMVDEGVTTRYYRDADEDGFGVPDSMATPVRNECSEPPGYAPNPDDCDDTLAGVSPAGTETCNGRDDDCSGMPDEGLRNTYYRDVDGDRYGETSMSMEACARPMGYAEEGGDCMDGVAAVHPGVADLCNGVDDDCNGTTDPGCACRDGMTQSCGATDVGECAYGTQRCVSGAWAECVGSIAPEMETCNTLDDDCDGMSDEMVRNTYYRDVDGDGFGTSTAGMTTAACSLPMGYSVLNTDCADSDGARNPAAFERCNTVDDDCDGTTDEGCTCTDGATRPCMRPMIGICRDGTQLCVGGAWGTCTGDVPPGTETCNGLDDDCDGMTDEMTSVSCYADSDSDGYGTGTMIARCPDTTRGMFGNCPSGYTNVTGDCNDANSAISPMDAEVCNGVDDNCAGGIDEGLTVTGCYADADSDTYGTGAATTQCRDGTRMAAGFCPVGFYNRAMDCNDTRAATNPGAMETCNAIDDDCDTMVDDGVRTTFYRDTDGDGFGTSSMTMMACSAPAGYVVLGTDCADGDSSRNPAATERCDGTLDDDCDGTVDEMCSCTNGMTRPCGTSSVGACRFGTQLCSGGIWGTCSGNIEPSMEVCNGADDDCDAMADELLTVTCYVDGDSDGDGTGSPSARCPDISRPAFGNCPSGFTSDAGDCNDSNMSIRPGATEICNGTDDNCNMMTDEGTTASGCYADGDSDGYGRAGTALTLCRDGSRGSFGFCPVGYTNNSTDCNDSDPAISPGDTEACNGIDDNCAGGIDEGLTVMGCYVDADSDTYGTGTASTQCRDGARAGAGFCPVGYYNRAMDCNDTRAATNPGAMEACNGIDDDCDLTADDGVQNTYYRDMDGDGYGTSTTTMACGAPAGYAPSSGDCNDMRGDVHPFAAEVCDTADNDCDGMADEGVRPTWYRDFDGDLYGDGTLDGSPAMTMLACMQPAGYVGNDDDCDDMLSTVSPVGTERCNNDDDDCDGAVDDPPANTDCNAMYPFPMTTFACSAGVCSITGCPPGSANCTGGVADGCETNINTDEAHCGACSGPTAVCSMSCFSGVCQDPTQISVGNDHTCARLANGRVLCWGNGNFGQLGNSGYASSYVPVQVFGLVDATMVSANYGNAPTAHTCAVRATGDAVCWGANAVGQLGIGNNLGPRIEPVTVIGMAGTSWTAIATGQEHTCAIRSEAGMNQVLCWGLNDAEQIGNTVTFQGTTPAPYRTLPDYVDSVAPVETNTATQIGVGTKHSCALRADGTVVCWGSDQFGQLGDGAVHATCTLAGSGTMVDCSENPVVVATITGVSHLAVGATHACVVRSGQVWCWGNNAAGQLGDGTTTMRPTPVMVPGISTAVSVSAGAAHSCARLASGQVQCWGLDSNGQLGDGTAGGMSLVPVNVSTLSNAMFLSSGGLSSCAIRTGSAPPSRDVCWGSNAAGQLGDGTTMNRAAPVEVSALP